MGQEWFCHGVYVVNDLLDRNEDLHHPVKRFRPLAVGRVSTTVAVGLLSFLWIAGAGVGLLASRIVLLILLTYVVVPLVR